MFVSKVTVSSLDNKHSGERLGLIPTDLVGVRCNNISRKTAVLEVFLGDV